jgi:hypothetical protein
MGVGSQVRLDPKTRKKADDFFVSVRTERAQLGRRIAKKNPPYFHLPKVVLPSRFPNAPRTTRDATNKRRANSKAPFVLVTETTHSASPIMPGEEQQPPAEQQAATMEVDAPAAAAATAPTPATTDAATAAPAAAATDVATAAVKTGKGDDDDKEDGEGSSKNKKRKVAIFLAYVGKGYQGMVGLALFTFHLDQDTSWRQPVWSMHGPVWSMYGPVWAM